jgi:small subunit ribosomal protein S5
MQVKPIKPTLEYSNTKRLEQKWKNQIIEVRRVTKVGKGHKRFNFRVIVIIGNGKGHLGLGIGKHKEITIARLKAIRNASKKCITIGYNHNKTIYNTLTSQFRKCKVILNPLRPGAGLRASTPIRIICTLGGIENISAKQFGSNNILHTAIATFNALKRI